MCSIAFLYVCICLVVNLKNHCEPTSSATIKSNLIQSKHSDKDLHFFVWQSGGKIQCDASSHTHAKHLGNNEGMLKQIRQG